jgi:Fe-S-cluster containining protein
MNRKERRSKERELRKRARKGDQPAAIELAVSAARSLSFEELRASRFSDDLVDLQIRQRAAVANAIARLLVAGQTRAIHIVETAHSFAHTLADHFEERRIACKEGCSWCCHMRVTALPVEVLAIATALRETLPEGKLESLRVKIADVVAKTAGVSWVDRAPTPCPLLDDGMCSVYALRPLACRAYHSFAVTPCRDYVERGTWEGLQVRINNFKRAPFDQAMQGMKDAICEHGLESEEVDLAAALRIALKLPDAMARWLRGERLFQPAYLPANEPSVFRRRLPMME